MLRYCSKGYFTIPLNLPDFYICKTWSHIFVLREEITLRLLEYRVLKKVFGFKRK